MCENRDVIKADLKSVGALHQDDVVQRDDARAIAKPEFSPKQHENEIPPKKRKTRRGKNKRRNVHPYNKNDRKSAKLNKVEAPYNSNQFLLEDHGNIEELDQKLKYNNDQASTSTVTRTRDSSFSVDSDGEFYSSPDDEEEFLIKDFDDQYERLQAERLHSMSKSELIDEYLMLESRVEVLTKHLKSKINNREQTEVNNRTELQCEVERLTIENETLKRENNDLRNKISVSCSSDSEDSETDSSDSCSSSTSSMSRTESPVVDYTQTNGHSPNLQTV